jgi:hypothetical protein
LIVSVGEVEKVNADLEPLSLVGSRLISGCFYFSVLGTSFIVMFLSLMFMRGDLMMANITQKARNVIEHYNLGIPTEVYRTNALVGIIFGLIFMVFGIAWSLIAAIVIDGSLFLLGQSSGQAIDPSLSSGVNLFGIVTGAFGIIFPLFGLIFVGIGLMIFSRAILNRNNQAVVCTDGVAYVTRKSADAFRWEQVLMVFNRTSVSRSTTHNEYGGSSESTSINHKYAVHCHDGRKFVFDNSLRKVEDLGERIEVEVARRRMMVM